MERTCKKYEGKIKLTVRLGKAGKTNHPAIANGLELPYNADGDIDKRFCF